MSTLAEFYFASQASIVQLELVEISHPDFTQVYYVVRNAAAGVTVTHEDAGSHAYEYYPMDIKQNGARDNLDVSMKISFGDLGKIIPKELDAVRAADGFNVKPTLKYRTYRSDNLAAPLYGPLVLEVTSISTVKEGATLDARAPLMNLHSTGENYDLDRFPMLRGFL